MSLNAPRDVVPDFRILKVDETYHWREDIRQAAGTILSVYLVDVSSRTYCCEPTPSYELELVGYTWTRIQEEESAQEQLSEDINRAFQQESEVIHYRHCSSIQEENLEVLKLDPAHWADLVEGHEGDQDRACAELREELLEYLVANGYVG